jgi:hypothetical protein
MRRIGEAALAATVALAAQALAVHAAQAAPAVDAKRAAVVEAISDCRKQTEDAARLACYDKAADAFEQAQTKGDVVVVSREEVRQVHRQSFGFNMPSINIFSHGAKEAPVDNLNFELASARQDPTGKWEFVTSEDTAWRQIDTTQLVNDPRHGDKLVIRRAMLSSFFCKVNNEPAVRCARER